MPGYILDRTAEYAFGSDHLYIIVELAVTAPGPGVRSAAKRNNRTRLIMPMMHVQCAHSLVNFGHLISPLLGGMH